jgi:hypothetical protein
VLGGVLTGLFRSQGTTPDVTLAGWTRIGQPFDAGASGGRILGLFAKVADANDVALSQSAGSYSFAVASRNVGGIAYWDAADVELVVTGFAPDIRGVYESAAGNTAPKGRRSPSYALSAPSLVFVLAGNECVAGISHVPQATPAGFTTLLNHQTGAGTSGSRTGIWVGYKEEMSGIAPSAFVGWGDVSGEATQSVALRLKATPPPVEGYPVRLSDGRTGQAFVLTGGERVTPTDIRVAAPEPVMDVPQLLATPGATWAHRGGSLSYPEMSMYAYDHAVARGYPALEVSFGRTSDAVRVGLHDNDINRVAGTSGLPAIKDMTWAQVQEHQITIGPGGPQPFMRWEQIRDAYGSSHVLVLDPKNYGWGAFRDEFLAMCMELGPSRVIVKQYMSDTGLADAAAALGFETWGYAYQADYASGDLALWAPHWSLLGMDIGASQAAWDATLAFDKPVVGHIAASQAAYNTAISKGAQMVQCSNVAGIAAVS